MSGTPVSGTPVSGTPVSGTTASGTTASLAGLMRANRIAIVGASERSMFTRHLMQSIDGAGSTTDVHMVNPKATGAICGRTPVGSVADLPDGIDLAYLAVGAGRVNEILEELSARAIRYAVVLSGGFSEAGTAAGRALQESLVETAEKHDMLVLGPNTLGFVNNTTGLTAMGTRLPPVIPSGDIAIVSQSGAVGSTLVNFAARDQIGVSWLLATGNEAMITAADAVAYAAADPATEVVALYLESIRTPGRFLDAVGRAAEAGKRVVVCKAGSGEAAKRVAAAHTGGIAGDDAVVDAVLRQHGVIRVHSAEELVYTAKVASAVGSRVSRDVGFLSMSGGFCAQAADLGHRAGLSFPTLSHETVAAVRAVPEADPEAVFNPLDTTGAATTRVAALADIAEAMGSAPELGMLLLGVPAPHTPAEVANHLSDVVAAAANRLHGVATTPTFFVENMSARLSEICDRYFRENHAVFLPGGLAHVMRALGRLADWADWARGRSTGRATGTSAAAADHARVPDGPERWNEVESRTYLESFGVATVPGSFATSEDEAVAAAEAHGYPVVLKAVGRNLQHKTEVGGVRLRVPDPAAVRSAYRDIVDSVTAGTGTAPEGTLVGPMRTGGVELIVGVIADDMWGQILAVGLGGVWTEVLRDAALRVLPVTVSDVESMLRELRGHAILDGYRGAPAVDRAALVEQILAIAAAATAGADRLRSLEVNPVLADGDRIEALDGLVEWQE